VLVEIAVGIETAIVPEIAAKKVFAAVRFPESPLLSALASGCKIFLGLAIHVIKRAINRESSIVEMIGEMFQLMMPIGIRTRHQFLRTIQLMIVIGAGIVWTIMRLLKLKIQKNVASEGYNASVSAEKNVKPLLRRGTLTVPRRVLVMLTAFWKVPWMIMVHRKVLMLLRRLQRVKLTWVVNVIGIEVAVKLAAVLVVVRSIRINVKKHDVIVSLPTRNWCDTRCASIVRSFAEKGIWGIRPGIWSLVLSSTIFTKRLVVKYKKAEGQYESMMSVPVAIKTEHATDLQRMRDADTVAMRPPVSETILEAIHATIDHDK
jgi:hypothetical protein